MFTFSLPPDEVDPAFIYDYTDTTLLPTSGNPHSSTVLYLSTYYILQSLVEICILTDLRFSTLVLMIDEIMHIRATWLPGKTH